MYKTVYLYFDMLMAFLYAEEQVQEIMTTEERQKLYDAIGYEENVDTDLPMEVCCILHFRL